MPAQTLTTYEKYKKQHSHRCLALRTSDGRLKKISLVLEELSLPTPVAHGREHQKHGHSILYTRVSDVHHKDTCVNYLSSFWQTMSL